MVHLIVTPRIQRAVDMAVQRLEKTKPKPEWNLDILKSVHSCKCLEEDSPVDKRSQHLQHHNGNEVKTQCECECHQDSTETKGQQKCTKSIPHAAVVSLSEYLLSEFPENCVEFTFERLVRGSGIAFETPPIREKSKELQKVLEDARIKQGNLEYDRMTQDIRRLGNQSLISTEDRHQFKALMGAFSGIINVLFSMVAVFVAVYWVGDTIVRDTALKTLFALGCSFIVGIAEGYFFTRDWLRQPQW